MIPRTMSPMERLDGTMSNHHPLNRLEGKVHNALRNTGIISRHVKQKIGSRWAAHLHSMFARWPRRLRILLPLFRCHVSQQTSPCLQDICLFSWSGSLSHIGLRIDKQNHRFGRRLLGRRCRSAHRRSYPRSKWRLISAAVLKRFFLYGLAELGGD